MDPTLWVWAALLAFPTSAVVAAVIVQRRRSGGRTRGGLNGTVSANDPSAGKAEGEWAASNAAFHRGAGNPP